MKNRLSARCFLAFAPLLAFAASAAEAACRAETFEDTDYTICSFDLSETDLRLFWRSEDGEPYRTFGALAEDLQGNGLALSFAMNGGMYGEDFSPIGLYAENGEELSPANTASVETKPEPNFYKKPNGIFYLGGDQAGIMTTEAFLAARPDAEFATQSGPMLLIDGAIHPAFIVGSSDRTWRNGVGIGAPNEVHFALSEDRVNFHDFARFFRDHLGTENALFLDGGSAPGLYAPDLDRDDRPGHGGYGPIIGAVE